jgi:Alpha/beta hydrolase of unknown function (DUF1023).
MPTWEDIQEWAPDPLRSAAEDLADSRATLVDAAVDAQSALDAVRSRGETVDAARAALTEQVEALDALVADVSEVLMATSEAADGVWNVQTMVDECQQRAATNSLVIAADGSVPWEQKVVDDPTQYPSVRIETNRPQAEALAGMVTRALARARKVDADYRSRLEAVRDGTYTSAEDNSSFSQGLADLPDSSWSTEEVATWWQALTEKERSALIAEHPDLIGNLDGIDMTSRDLANQRRLGGLIEAAQDEYDQALDALLHTTDENDALAASATVMRARERLQDLEAVRDTLGTSTGSNRRRLLLLDTSGERAKAAIAVGDVDSARHVATYVPGMNTTLRDSLDSAARRMVALRSETAVTSGVRTSDVATIAWLGYDAPQDVVQAASTSRAHTGSDRLESFTQGVQSSRMASGAGHPHHTVLGHSYGSTTSGLAVRDVRSGTVDDLVLFGSPGSGVQDVREYNMDAGHAWVSAVDSHDIVQGIGPDHAFGKNPAKMEGFEHLSNRTRGASSFWGWFNPADRHSTYLDDGSGSLRDFAAVVGGTR